MGLASKFTFIFSSLLLLGLSGCASKSVEVASACAQMDWYELGRRDGAEGVPSDRNHKTQPKECTPGLTPELESMYNNGRNAGLVEYCEPKNAYEMGRMGVAYFYVCPSTVEPQFLSSYRKGQNIRALEVQNQKLDEQIVELGQKLAQSSSDSDQQQDIEEQLQDLKSKRNQNSRQLSKIISN